MVSFLLLSFNDVQRTRFKDELIKYRTLRRVETLLAISRDLYFKRKAPTPGTIDHFTRSINTNLDLVACSSNSIDLNLLARSSTPVTRIRIRREILKFKSAVAHTGLLAVAAFLDVVAPVVVYRLSNDARGGRGC